MSKYCLILVSELINFKESRDERRGTWRQFMAKKAKKEYEGKSLKGTAFKPPKIKLETSGK